MAQDLIDLDLARQHLPTSADSDEPVISNLITAASRAVQKYCRRDFTSTTYDELYNGAGDRRLMLRQYPLLSVQAVRYRPVTVLKIMCTNAQVTTPQARVTVTSTGLTLAYSLSGGLSTNTSITWASYPTLIQVQNAINAIPFPNNVWQAVGQGYDNWPSADLYCPNGPSTSDSALPASQGALTAAGQFAALKMHTYELAGYQMDQRRGWLLRAIPYTDPELLHPEDLIWPVGVNNFRVQYTAGYATVPEDVQEATALLVASWFRQLGRDVTLARETNVGVYSYEAITGSAELPERVRALLDPYRVPRVISNQS